MSENSQGSLFENERDLQQSLAYQGGSLASLTALQGSIKRLLTSVICGRGLGEPLAKLDHCGLWLKMYGDYYQANMDGSFEEYSEILPTWGLMLDGALYQPQALEPYIDESEWRLLPTPTASMWRGAAKKRYMGSKQYKASFTMEALRNGPGDAQYMNPNYAEVLMGFPDKWTDLNASGTP